MMPAPVLLTLEAPIRVVSEANAHEHWRVRQKRAKEQRGLIQVLLRDKLAVAPEPPLVVLLTRIAPRALDSDNLAGAFKHVRDGIADWLDINDRSPLVTWLYTQLTGVPKTYAIRVELSRRIEPIAASGRKRRTSLTPTTSSTTMAKRGAP